MAWRPANSLVTLRNQLNTSFPGWLFLGFIGDQSHARVASDHNPNAQGVVCALDIGAGGGLDIHELAENLRKKPHPNLKYIISNSRIALAEIGWAWGYYDGIDPHDTHIHVSVGRGPDGKSTQPYDDAVQWNVAGEDEMSQADIQKIYETIHNSDKIRDEKISRIYQDFVKPIEQLQKDLSEKIDRIYNDFVPPVESLQKDLNRLNNAIDTLNKAVFDNKK